MCMCVGGWGGGTLIEGNTGASGGGGGRERDSPRKSVVACSHAAAAVSRRWQQPCQAGPLVWLLLLLQVCRLLLLARLRLVQLQCVAHHSTTCAWEAGCLQTAVSLV